MDKKPIMLALAAFLLVGAIFVSATLQDKEVTESNENVIEAPQGCGTGSCGSENCDGSCGGKCGVKSCGCGR